MIQESDIDALIECVLRSDWNCCAHDKPELYKIWNEIIKNPNQLKQQILDALKFQFEYKDKIEGIKQYHKLATENCTLIDWDTLNKLQQIEANRQKRIKELEGDEPHSSNCKCSCDCRVIQELQNLEIEQK